MLVRTHEDENDVDDDDEEEDRGPNTVCWLSQKCD